MPTNEAMRAAEAIFNQKKEVEAQNGFMFRNEAIEIWGYIVDQKTGLPALLAVADAAREVPKCLIALAGYYERCWQKESASKVRDMEARLLAALEKLPPRAA